MLTVNAVMIIVLGMEMATFVLQLVLKTIQNQTVVMVIIMALDAFAMKDGLVLIVMFHLEQIFRIFHLVLDDFKLIVLNYPISSRSEVNRTCHMIKCKPEVILKEKQEAEASFLFQQMKKRIL